MGRKSNRSSWQYFTQFIGKRFSAHSSSIVWTTYYGNDPLKHINNSNSNNTYYNNRRSWTNNLTDDTSDYDDIHVFTVREICIEVVLSVDTYNQYIT